MEREREKEEPGVTLKNDSSLEMRCCLKAPKAQKTVRSERSGERCEDGF